MLVHLWLLLTALVAFAGDFVLAQSPVGPTAVEQAKRFEPSIGLCIRLCPNLEVAAVNGLLVVAISSGGVQTVPGGDTVCSYTYFEDSIEAVVTDTCIYAQDGLLTGSTLSVGSSCPPTAAFSPGCINKRKRKETRLQQVVRERQWKGPARRRA